MASSRFIFRRILAAGATDNINFGGTFFYVVQADGPVRIGNDDEDGDVFDVGTGWKGAQATAFRKLKIRNEHTAAQLVEIAVGEGEYRDNRFTLVPTRNLGVPMYPAPTRLAPRPETSIPAASGITLSGVVAAPDVLRKAIIVQNLDATNNIELRVGGVVANIVPYSPVPITHTFELSGPVEVWNPNGAAVAVRIAEIIVTAG